MATLFDTDEFAGSYTDVTDHADWHSANLARPVVLCVTCYVFIIVSHVYYLCCQLDNITTINYEKINRIFISTRLQQRR